MPGTCITNMPRTHRFGVTTLGAFKTALTTTSTSKYRLVSNNLVWTPTFSQDEGHNGTAFYDEAGVVLDTEAGSGSVVLQPRADEYRTILPLLLGSAFATDDISPPTDGYCQFFDAQVDKSIAMFNFFNCKTSQWTLSSSRSQPRLQLDWGIEACSMVRVLSSAFPTLTYSTLPPFVHTSSTMTIDGDTVPIDDVSITGNNNLQDVAYNTTTRTDLPTGRQVFSFTATSPFDDAGDVAWFDYGTSHVAASMVYTSGLMSLTITFPNVHPVVPTPATPGGDTPVRHEGIVWTARASGATLPITFTLDDNNAA